MSSLFEHLQWGSGDSSCSKILLKNPDQYLEEEEEARVFIMLKPTKTFGELSVTLQIANNKSVDQTARMRRLVCAFVVSKKQYQGFSRQGPYDVEAQASWLPHGCAPALLRSCYLWVNIFIKDATESSVEEFARMLGSFVKTEQRVLGFITFRINFTEVM